MTEDDQKTVWGQVAERYGAFWTPRFRPFVESALAAFSPGLGPIWIPGCGPGDEALLIAERFPERAVIASDPAAPMLALLRARELPANLDVRLGSARDLPEGSLGGIFSSFTLQLLPEKLETLRAWGLQLGKGGCIAALFWPRQDESDAWGVLDRAREAVTGQARSDWESPLEAGLAASGLELVTKRDVRLPIAYASPEEAWRALCDGCSYQALLRRVGPEQTEAVGRRWLERHGLTEEDGGWTHRPTARLWVLRQP